MKTKILSFILFAILLIFTSCGGGTTNSGNTDINDNPQFEKSVLDSITVKTLPTKTQYSVGETLDPTGLVLQGNYIDYFSDGSTQTSKLDIDYNTYKNELAFSPTNLSTEGSIKITVTYNKKSTTFNITVGKSSSDSKYAGWFKEVKIGGEDSPYKVYIPEHSYNDFNQLVDGSINNYLDQYQKYIASLSLNEELTGGVEIDFAQIKELSGQNEQRKLDTVIGTIKNTDPNTIKGINNVCAPAIEEITKNIGISGNNGLDKQLFTLFYKAISNEIYRIGYNGEITTKTECIGNETEMEQKYINTKKDCSKYDGYTVLPFENKYFYLETGELNPEVVIAFNQMITKASDRLNIDVNELRKIVNLSLTASAIEGVHDDLSTSHAIEHTHTDSCYNNQMVDVIENVKVDDMVAQAKLNKSIFSQNFGRELC